MTGSTDAIAQLLATARGSRPASMACGEAEEALTVGLALAVELVVANDRIDRLERQVASLAGIALDDWRADFGDAEDARARREANDALLMRVMRIFIDPRADVQA